MDKPKEVEIKQLPPDKRLTAWPYTPERSFFDSFHIDIFRRTGWKHLGEGNFKKVNFNRS